MLLSQEYTKAIFTNVTVPCLSLHTAPSFLGGNKFHCFLMYPSWVNICEDIISYLSLFLKYKIEYYMYFFAVFLFCFSHFNCCSLS